MKIKLFDGHCDTILRCYNSADAYFNGGRMRENSGHVELARAHGAFDGYAQFFAIFADAETMPGTYARHFEGEYALFCREMEANADIAVACRTAAEAERAISGGKIAAFLSVEGAEILECSLERLADAYKKGVRAVNITWNHANALSGTNVERPEQGLTGQGEAFVRRMQELGMLVDVSHLSDPGFWDVAALAEEAGKPFFASHSNSRALCPHPRNLTDEQFKELARLGGVAGLNTCDEFLSETAPGLDAAVAHIEHFCGLGGEKNVAIGGDWDGCDLFPGIERITDIGKLYERLLQRNFKETLVQDIFYNNLMRVVKEICTM